MVENRPGGGGTIGMVAAAKAPPDGYTLVMVYSGVASVNPVLIPGLPYNTARDFAPIGLVGSFPMLLIARPDFPARDTKDDDVPHDDGVVPARNRARDHPCAL